MNVVDMFNHSPNYFIKGHRYATPISYNLPIDRSRKRKYMYNDLQVKTHM